MFKRFKNINLAKHKMRLLTLLVTAVSLCSVVGFAAPASAHYNPNLQFDLLNSGTSGPIDFSFVSSANFDTTNTINWTLTGFAYMGNYAVVADYQYPDGHLVPSVLNKNCNVALPSYCPILVEIPVPSPLKLAYVWLDSQTVAKPQAPAVHISTLCLQNHPGYGWIASNGGVPGGC